MGTRNALSDLRSRETGDLIHAMNGDRLGLAEAPRYLVDIVEKLHERVGILEAEVAALKAEPAR